MPTLALVDQNGRPLTNEKPTTPSSNDVETVDEPLWVIAARAAAKQSTKVKETK